MTPKPPSSPPCARAAPRRMRSPWRSPAPTPPGPSSTGASSSAELAPSACRCPPTPSSASATGSTPLSERIGDLGRAGQEAAEHPLLGAAVELADGEARACSSPVASPSPPTPGSPTTWSAAACCCPAPPSSSWRCGRGSRSAPRPSRSSPCEAPLVLPETGAVAIQVSVSGADEDGRREIAIHSRPDAEDAEWVRERRGALSDAAHAPHPSPWTPGRPREPSRSRSSTSMTVLAEAGLEYGPAFQGLTRRLARRRADLRRGIPPRGAGLGGGALRHPPGACSTPPCTASHSAQRDGARRGPEPALLLERRLPSGPGARELRVKIAPARARCLPAFADGSGTPLATVELAASCGR